MTIGLNATLRNARLNVIRDAIDAGTAAGTLKIYSGTRPATGAAPTASEVLLGTLTFSDPCAPAASGGVLTFSAITGANAVADGTATWARASDSAGTFVMDLSVGATGSGADITLNTTAIVTGGPISVTSATITSGNA